MGFTERESPMADGQDKAKTAVWKPSKGLVVLFVIGVLNLALANNFCAACCFVVTLLHIVDEG
jgi:hypothetical protein